MKITIILGFLFFWCSVPFALGMEYKKETLTFSIEALQDHIVRLNENLEGTSEGAILIKRFLEDIHILLFAGGERVELLKEALEKVKEIQSFTLQPEYKEQKCTVYGESELTLEQFSKGMLSSLRKAIEKAYKLQGPIGLENYDKETKVSNRCFMNAALQCLYSLTDLTKVLFKSSKLYVPHSISEQYLNLLVQLGTAENLSCNPLEFSIQGWDLMKQPISSQQDAAEFIQFLLNHLISQDIQGGKGENKEASSLFTLSLATHIMDQRPRREHQAASTRPETILNLSVSSKHKTLTDCLDSYFDLEEVAIGNGKGQKITRLHKSGKYVILALNRKVYSNLTSSYYKLNHPVSFKLENFNALGAYSDQANITFPYRLVGCIIHAGNPLGGHYTAYVRYGEQWYFCDDSTVKAIDIKEMEEVAMRGYGNDKTQTPVLFFYEAQGE